MRSILYTPILSLILLLVIPALLHGETYHASPDGSNDNSGSESAPFRTIQKAVSIMSPGDSCLVRGGTYRETVTIGVSDVVIRNHPGELVVITGTDVVTGWTQHKENIFKAAFTGVETQFFHMNIFDSLRASSIAFDRRVARFAFSRFSV